MFPAATLGSDRSRAWVTRISPTRPWTVPSSRWIMADWARESWRNSSNPVMAAARPPQHHTFRSDGHRLVEDLTQILLDVPRGPGRFPLRVVDGDREGQAETSGSLEAQYVHGSDLLGVNVSWAQGLTQFGEKRLRLQQIPVRSLP